MVIPMTSTPSRRPSAGRLASAVLAAALLAAGPMTAMAASAPDDATTTTPTTTPTTAMPSAADTDPSTSEPAPMASTVDPTAPANVTVARPAMIQRDAVTVGATGFKLQYRFDGNVQTSTPAQRSDPTITPENFYDWSDAGHRYVQWDYPMPTDGVTTVTMTAPLIDLGRATDYTVEFTSHVNRTAGSIAVETTCRILRGGVAVNLDDDSPFTCDGTSAQAATGAVVSIGSVRDLDWATITSRITTRNDGAGPRISLGDGTFSTANQEQRIIMNGSEWYPTELTPREQRSLPYATIANGQSLTWSAVQRNGTPQSAPDRRAQATFAYRIHLDGAPTTFWINGFAESYRYLSSESSDASCEIFLGNPDTTGQTSQRATPFTCSAVNNSSWSSDGTWHSEWDFDVRMADVDTLHQQRDAVLRGVKDACTPDTGPCIQAVGRPSCTSPTSTTPRPSGPTRTCRAARGRNGSSRRRGHGRSPTRSSSRSG